MSRTKKEVNLVKKEVVNLARKEKNGVNLAKKECQSGKKRMWRGSKTFMFKASTILFLDEEKEEHVFILPCVYTIHTACGLVDRTLKERGCSGKLPRTI